MSEVEEALRQEFAGRGVELALDLGYDGPIRLDEGKIKRAIFNLARNAYSHFKVTLHAFRCRLLRGTPTPRAAVEWRWVPLAELDAYAFPKANRRILEALTAARDGAA